MKHLLVVIAGICISLAPAFAQNQESQKGSPSTRELIREHEAALKPYREQMDALSQRVEADIRPLREQQEQLVLEMKKELVPLQTQQETLGQKFQSEVDQLADSNPTVDEYEKGMQRIRATYDPEGVRLEKEIEAVQKKF